jgi:hypothetical protein
MSKTRLTTEQYISKAKSVHGSRFNYDKTIYVDSNTKVIITCPKHGDFEQKTHNHLNGAICNKCGYENRIKTKISTLLQDNSLYDKFPALCEEWSSKNNSNPQDHTYSSHKKALWCCSKCKHEYSSIIHHRTLSGSGCPRCSSSKGERRIENFLKENNVKYTIQYRIEECKNKRVLPFDFAVWINNKLHLIEYHGQQHYSVGTISWNCTQEQLDIVQSRDQIKQDFCEENNIPLLIIPYTDFKKVEEILQKFVNGA